MSTEQKPSNPFAFPYSDDANGYSQDGMTLRDYSQIKFMAAIISNADTMREINRTYNNTSKDKRIEFEELIAKLAGSYADAQLKQREL